MAEIRRGLIIVNTGPGKGKTTAAMGIALRAVGNGMRVLMLQFIKGSWHYGELDAAQAFGDKFIMKQMGRGFVKLGAEKPDPEDVRLVEEAWTEGEHAIQSGKWDLVTPMARAGIAAGADGLMIEVHPNPSEALKDGFESLTFENFSAMMDSVRAVARALGRPVASDAAAAV